MKQLFKIALMLVAIFTALSAKANDVLMATLQHDGETTVFYNGAESLKTALAAAVSGDVINLSPGSFNSPTIDKAVTIIGAGGWNNDPATGQYLTKLKGDMTISIPDTDENQLVLEGFYTENTIKANGILKNAIFKRIQVKYIDFRPCSTVNCSILQSRIYGSFYPDENSQNLYIANSILQTIYSNKDTASLFLKNCWVNNASDNPTITAENTIFFSISAAPNCNFTNCLWCRWTDGGRHTYDISSYSVTEHCWKLDSTQFNNIWVDGNKWTRLTEEAAATYLGTDGKEIGIYGGMGWVTDPSIPKISAAQVDTQTTADGKLNITFTVEAQQ